MKRVIVVVLIGILCLLCILSYLLGYKQGYRKGYSHKTDSLIEVRFPNGAVAESIDAVENYGY